MPVAGNAWSSVRDRGVLVRVDGDTAGCVVSLPREGAVIGRSIRADISVPDESVSRTHTRIQCAHGTFVVEDLGSRNGTFVAGRRVTACRLNDGDLLQIGARVTYRFSLMDGAQESALRQLYASSVRDPLTGVFNRRHFDQRLANELAFARRHGTNIGLVLFDIDHFKQVNDQHGHSAGDGVLTRLAHMFHEQLRTEDLLARYGGEEFVVLLRGSDIGCTQTVAERIRRRVAAEPVELASGRHLWITISAGCASMSGPDPKGDQSLVDIADRRLYLAKRQGRNRVIVAD